MTEGLI